MQDLMRHIYIMDSISVSTSFSINNIPVNQEQKFIQGFSMYNF